MRSPPPLAAALACALLAAGCHRAPARETPPVREAPDAPAAPTQAPEAPARGGGAIPGPLATDPSRPAPLDAIELPDGFSIAPFHAEVPGARSLARGAEGTVFVGTRGQGIVWALRDEDGDGIAERREIVARGLNAPNGVAWHDGALYVAEIERILRFDDAEARLGQTIEPVVVLDKLPSDRHHGWRYIKVGPDEKLYVAIGAPCNVCRSSDERYASIARLNLDGSDFEIFASGVRNSVGFDWHPEGGALWFTDNGRDMMGDDIPPDELNVAPKAGLHFGFPYCHGGTIQDPRFDERPCSAFRPPAIALAPHAAALGMRFVRGDGFGAAYRGSILIAEHGSWNRTKPIGYRISLVTLDEAGRASAYRTFARGWLEDDGGRRGRPVDLLELADGSFLVSDDYAGAVWRIWREDDGEARP